MIIAILGAGYAGLTVARHLEDSLPDDVELVVVDDTGEHLVRHELHRVIRRPSFADEITIPLEDVLQEATVRRARVTNVDPDAGRATLDDGPGSPGNGVLEYDYAAVCLGATTEFYGLPGVAEHGFPLEHIEHARAIREAALDANRIVVGGAGLTGVQVAGELAALAREETRDPDIVLLEQFDAVAPGFASNFQEAIREELEARGVEVRTGSAVARASADAVELEDGASIAHDALVWTGGIRGPDSLDGNRTSVRSDLRLGDGTFVVGDAASVVDRDGELVPASAQAAIREARTAAVNIRRLVEAEAAGDGAFSPRLETFDFEPRAWIVSVGGGAVAKVGPTVLRGSSALALKATVGVRYLTSVGAVREAIDLASEEFSAGGETT